MEPLAPGQLQEPRARGDRDIIQVDYASGRDSLTLQTVYLEPLDTPVLFGLPRIVGVQGNFPMLLTATSTVRFRSLERASGSNESAIRFCPTLRCPRRRSCVRTTNRYSRAEDNYLQLAPNSDPRIREARRTSYLAGPENRYDAAKTTESYLQNNLRLHPRAKGRRAPSRWRIFFST